MAALKVTPSVHSIGQSRPSSARTTGTGTNFTVDLLTFQNPETDKTVDKMTPEQISGILFSNMDSG